MTAQRTLMKKWIPSLLAAAGMLITLIVLASNGTAMNSIQRLLALISSAILNVLGQNTEVIGTTVQSSVFGISVVTACTGIFITGLFLIAVAALPTRWMAKLIGAGIGIGGIFLVNIVRLVSLYFIGVHWPSFLEQAHQLIWQSLLIVVAVSLWLLWAGRWAYVPRSN
ncbi:archaeosortase/exosortase family protein [Candidatus Bipolaricaulota bacterium]|nr:archaeosortase/exosortase family protein [Candidatus Bipolaricaulota bacterium]